MRKARRVGLFGLVRTGPGDEKMHRERRCLVEGMAWAACRFCCVTTLFCSMVDAAFPPAFASTVRRTCRRSGVLLTNCRRTIVRCYLEPERTSVRTSAPDQSTPAHSIIEWLPKSYESPMAQPNYSYAKRQRELAKKK